MRCVFHVVIYDWKYCNHLCLRSICPENFAASYPALNPSNASLLSQLVRRLNWMVTMRKLVRKWYWMATIKQLVGKIEWQ